MAISTFNTHLYYKDGSDWVEPVEIKNVPSLYGEPNQLETTTLSDPQQTFIAGIRQSGGIMAFNYNYTSESFDTVAALEEEGELTWILIFKGELTEAGALPTNHEGVFTFKGTVSPGLNEGGVDEVVEAVLNITPTTAPSKVTTLPTA